jgi:hypothetical protein
MVIVLAVSFLLLMGALLIGSFTTPEFPPYAPTVPAPDPVGDTLVGPVTYTVEASAPEAWKRFDFSRAAMDAWRWQQANPEGFG